MGAGNLAAMLGGTSGLENPLLVAGLILVLSLLPFCLLAVTSFVKLSVVFSILRNALGASQFPSGAVTSTLAFVLTLHIMAPVAREAWQQAASAALPQTPKEAKGRKPPGVPPAVVLQQWGRVMAAGAGPVENFLKRRSRIEERAFFAGLRREEQGAAHTPDLPQASGAGEIAGEDFFTLVPSFLLSELRAAFAVGFTIFLPFLAIDLVVANLLVGLGMMMVSPAAISLPFKLLLFVLTDGWFMLCRSLILSYQ